MYGEGEYDDLKNPLVMFGLFLLVISVGLIVYLLYGGTL